MRVLASIPVLLLCTVAALADDPFEHDPMQMSVVVDARWGERPDEFEHRGDGWGRGEVGSFGPFAIDDAGRIYIHDSARKDANDVKVFAPDGTFLQTIDLIQTPNIVDDIAMVDGTIYTLGESLWGHRVLAIVPGAGRIDEVDVSNDAELLTDANGARYVGNCRFTVHDGDLGLFAQRAGVTYPLVRDARPLTAAEQIAGRSAGMACDGAAVRFDHSAGDIVRVAPDGRVEQVLMRNAGGLWGACGRFVLTETYEEVAGRTRFYFVLLDTDGKLISRTLMPEPSGLSIDIPQRIRLTPDGSIYLLDVGEDGVRVLRFIRS